MDNKDSNKTPEGGTSNKTAEHYRADLVTIERPEPPKPSTSLLALFSGYLLLVGTVIGGGVFAFYTQHRKITEWLFYISLVLLALIPLLLIGYLIVAAYQPLRRLAKRVFLSRFMKSIVRFLARHVIKFSYLGIAFSLIEIGLAIQRFPQHPRLSLALIVFYALQAAFLYSGTIEIKLLRDINYIGTVITRLLDVVRDLNQTVQHLEKNATRKVDPN